MSKKKTLTQSRLPYCNFASCNRPLIAAWELSGREAPGFEIAHQRPEQKFVYLERPEGAQIMLAEDLGERPL
jgi:hypothetical protein